MTKAVKIDNKIIDRYIAVYSIPKIVLACSINDTMNNYALSIINYEL
jgi:hypothetical protein